jgi:hypothetical protein
MTTSPMPLRRVQPEQITRCESADSACNGPKEGECIGLCPPRARAGAPYIAPMPVQMHEPVQTSVVQRFLGIFKKEWK